MNKAIKQNVLDKAKNKRADFLKNGSILWQGQKELRLIFHCQNPYKQAVLPTHQNRMRAIMRAKC